MWCQWWWWCNWRVVALWFWELFIVFEKVICWQCLLGSLSLPGVHGLCYLARKQPLLWVSCHSRAHFVKNRKTPHLISPFYLGLWERFGHTRTNRSVFSLIKLFAFLLLRPEIWSHSEFNPAQGGFHSLLFRKFLSSIRVSWTFAVGKQIFALAKWSSWNLDQSRIRFRLMGTTWGVYEI